MGARTTLVLLFLVAIAGLFLWLDDAANEITTNLLTGTQPQLSVEEVNPLLAFDLESVEMIELTVHGQPPMRARRDSDGTWTGVRASYSPRDFLVNILRVGRVSEIDTDERGLSEFGLAPAQQVLRIHLTSGAPVEVAVGHSNPSTTGVYVQLRPEKAGPRRGTRAILLVGSVLRWELEKLERAMRAAGGRM